LFWYYLEPLWHVHDLVVGVVGLHLVDFCVVVFHFDFGKADLVN
jgi:hypothetical protein